MLAKHTPQSLMKMYWNQKDKKWLSKYVENSKTIQHYYDHHLVEVSRLPAWITFDAKHKLIMESEQMSHLVKLGVEMLEVNVGAYSSFFIHVDNVPL